MKPDFFQCFLVSCGSQTMAKQFLHLQKGLTRSKMSQNSRKRVQFHGFGLKSKIRPGHRVVLTKINIFCLVFPVIHVQIKGSRLSPFGFSDFGAKWRSLVYSRNSTGCCCFNEALQAPWGHTVLPDASKSTAYSKYSVSKYSYLDF